MKNIDSEKSEAQDCVNELTVQKTSLQTGKRKAEQQLSHLQEENEEMETEHRSNSDKLRKAMEQVCLREREGERKRYLSDYVVLLVHPPFRQGARMQSQMMTMKDKLSKTEKAKVYVSGSITFHKSPHLLSFVVHTGS